MIIFNKFFQEIKGLQLVSILNPFVPEILSLVSKSLLSDLRLIS